MCDLPLTSTGNDLDDSDDVTTPTDDTADGALQSVMVEDSPRPRSLPPIGKAILDGDIHELQRLLTVTESSAAPRPHAALLELRTMGLPALRLACHTHNLEVLRALIAAGDKVDAYDSLGQTPLHAAVASQWLDGAKLLLEHGSSVNAMPSAGAGGIQGVIPQESPLHFAVRTGDVPMTTLLLGRHEALGGSLLDTGFYNGIGGVSTGVTGKGGFADDGVTGPFSPTTPSTSDNTPTPLGGSALALQRHRSPFKKGFVSHHFNFNGSHPLWSKNSSVPSRLSSSVPEKIIEEIASVEPVTLQRIRSVPDLTLKDGNSRSLVHLAAHANSKEILEILLNYKECQILATSGDVKGYTPLHSLFGKSSANADESEVIACIDLLLGQDVDLNTMNRNGETALFLAAVKGQPEAVFHLLNKRADPTIVTEQEWTVLHAACSADCWKSLKYLLDTNRVNHFIFHETKDGNVPFNLATCSYSLACIRILLTHGDHLTNADSRGKTRCCYLLQNIPHASKFLEELFDEKITSCSGKRPHDAEFTLSFDYSILLSQRVKDVQCSLVAELTDSILDNMLTHPLIESFLFVKWNRIKPFFYTSFVVYALFLALHTYYVIRTFGSDPKDWSQDMVMLNLFRCFHIIVFMMIFIPDIIIMLANIKKYLRQWETYVKLVTLTTSAFILFSPRVQTPGEMMVERHVAAVSIFLAWVELMMLLGRFPVLGIYILMFTRVAKSIIKFLLAFSSLLIGFAIAFEIIFVDNKNFGSFPVSLVKTLMMMIGEIDYGNLVEQNGMMMPLLGYLFLVVFLFLVPILMANLLIGLAVSDLPDLSRQGKIKRLAKQASYLTAYEHLVLFFRELRCFPYLLRKILAERCRIKKKVTYHPNKRNFLRERGLRKWIEALPSETLDAATKIVQKKKEKLTGDGSDEEYDGYDSVRRANPMSEIAKRKPLPTALDKFGRTHSVMSRRSNISDNATRDQLQQINEASEAFEAEYKREFKKLKNFMRTHLVLNRQVAGVLTPKDAVTGAANYTEGSWEGGREGAKSQSASMNMAVLEQKMANLELKILEQNQMLTTLLNRQPNVIA